MKVIHLEETDSTNNYLKRLLVNEKPEEGTIACAESQSSGKGQSGNSWESEISKNLLFSIVLYPDNIKASEQFIISQIVSLAVLNTLNKYTADISIKWPNDIYWKEKKICGILIENSLCGDSIENTICGIGININQTEFRSNAPNPVSLKQITGKDYDLNTLLEEISESLYINYEKIKNEKTEDRKTIIKEYNSHLFRKDGYYTYNDGKENFRARIMDVQNNGILILETENGEIKPYYFKEVKYIL